MGLQHDLEPELVGIGDDVGQAPVDVLETQEVLRPARLDLLRRELLQDSRPGGRIAGGFSSYGLTRVGRARPLSGGCGSAADMTIKVPPSW